MSERKLEFAIGIPEKTGEQTVVVHPIVATSREAVEGLVKDTANQTGMFVTPCYEPAGSFSSDSKSSFGFSGSWKGSDWEPTGPHLKMGDYVAPRDNTIN